MKIEEAIGANLARLRDESGMSQSGLGKKIGVYLDKPWSRQAVSAAEKGRRSFTAAELVALALTLDVSMDFLLMPVAGGFADLLPGAKEVTAQDYERAIVGSAPNGGPNVQALHRARGALIASLKVQLDAHKDLTASMEQQALLLDHAAVALGITDAPFAENIDDKEGDGQ